MLRRVGGWRRVFRLRARIDDGLLLGESARNIVPDEAADSESRVFGNSCALSVTPRLFRISGRFENICFGFSSGLVVTLSRGGAPESPTS